MGDRDQGSSHSVNEAYIHNNIIQYMAIGHNYTIAVYTVHNVYIQCAQLL